MGKYTSESVTAIINELFSFVGLQDDAIPAAKVGVTAKTIGNWRKGLTVPKSHELFNLFDALDVPLEMFLKVRDNAVHDGQLKARIDWWHHNIATNEDMQCIDTIINGKHGSSVSSVLKMMSIYLCLPLSERMRICHNIVESYRFQLDCGNLQRTVKPEFVDDVMESMIQARQAAIKNQDYYSEK